MTTLTNAELAAAIEWAAHQLSQVQSPFGGHTVAADERLIFDHLTELLRIQRERAAAPTDVGKVPFEPLRT